MRDSNLIISFSFLVLISISSGFSIGGGDESPLGKGQRSWGGMAADLGEFPYVASIGMFENDNIHYYCTGTVINQQWILTAGSCGVEQFAAVKVGSVTSSTDFDKDFGPPPQILSVQRVIFHPERDPVKAPFVNDVALIQLTSFMDFNAYVKPVNMSDEWPSKGDLCTMVGWGWPGSTKNFQMKAPMQIDDDVRCQSTYPFFNSSDHICSQNYAKGTICGVTKLQLWHNFA